MSSVFSSAVSGLNAAIARVSNAASNIANASSRGKLPAVEGEKATSFQPQDVVNLTTGTGEVTTTTIQRNPAYHPMYDPNAPDANADGLVAEPNIDLANEMTDILMAEIVYKANLRAIKVEKDRLDETIDILS